METAKAESIWTAADFRAERARRQISIFKIAADIGCHPTMLGEILNERRIMTPRMAAKIAKVLGLPLSPEDGER